MNTKKILYIVISFFTIGISSAQTSDDVLNLLIQKGLVKQHDADSIRADYAIKHQEKPKDKTLLVDLQIKNRFEFRNGYGSLLDETTVPAAFVNQRSRLNFSYQHGNAFNAVFSIQDARVWGTHDPRGLGGTIQLFEGYVEPYLSPNFSIRIGRQRILYDNQRLFAENDWRVNASAHDAVNFRYNKDKLSAELVGAFNQTSERLFGTDFTPTELSITPANATPSNWTSYKALAINYLKYEFTPSTTATTIIAADGYQDATNKEKIHWRVTYGGRLEYKKDNWYATASGYLQTGRNNIGKTLEAWYIQPELKYTIPEKVSIRFGAELLSGDNGTVGLVDHNFVPLYGVVHRFNGFMDLFTKFPGDLNNAGLVNPYLFISKSINSKLEISSNNHLFYTQKAFVNAAKEALNQYMGYEHDLLVTYKPNNYTNIEGGFSFALPTDTMTAIKKSGDASKIATWAYIQVKFTPRLFKNIFN
jgi:Alginate export